MAEDPEDMEGLKDAFAALERSRKRVDTIIERDVLATRVELLTIPELILALESAGPLSDHERASIIDYLNSIELTMERSEPEKQNI